MSTPTIVTFTPFDAEMNLGRAYNSVMELLPDDAWACLLDHDMMLTTREWHRQLVEAATVRPDAAFTAITNRIASPWQQAREVDKNNHDIVYHRSIGRARLAQRTLLDCTDTKGWGGVLLLLSKRAWRDAGGFVDGMLCVDHQMHFALRATGRRLYVMENVYVYHWRRANGDDIPRNAPRAVGCPCRGPETMPTERVQLS